MAKNEGGGRSARFCDGERLDTVRTNYILDFLEEAFRGGQWRKVCDIR